MQTLRFVGMISLKRIYSYLKKGGAFVFGWSHPIHKCVSVEDGRLIFSNSYFNEEWYRADMGDKKIMLSNRMLSTYINSLAYYGFVIEKLTEETDRERAAVPLPALKDEKATENTDIEVFGGH